MNEADVIFNEPRVPLQGAYTLSALAKEQLVETKKAESAIKKFKIDKDRDFPSNL